jgi:hypothetical protein
MRVGVRSGRLVLAALLAATLGAPAAARQQRNETDIRHRFLACCFSKGKLVIVGRDGRFERVIERTGKVQDAWMLAGGNILYSHYGGAREVDPDGRTVWEYKTDRPRETEVHSAQPLPNGNVLVGESGRSRMVEVDRQGRVVKTIPVKTKSKGKHVEFRTCRRTLKGTYIAACMADGIFREVDGNGRLLRELVPGLTPQKNGAHAVVPLPNGHVLASTGYGKSFVEFDEKGKVIWKFGRGDVPAGYKLDYTCSIQLLGNGNRLVSTYHGRPQFLEITRDKKVVWSYEHPDLGEASGITLLDMPDPARGEVNR